MYSVANLTVYTNVRHKYIYRRPARRDDDIHAASRRRLLSDAPPVRHPGRKYELVMEKKLSSRAFAAVPCRRRRLHPAARRPVRRCLAGDEGRRRRARGERPKLEKGDGRRQDFRPARAINGGEIFARLPFCSSRNVYCTDLSVLFPSDQQSLTFTRPPCTSPVGTRPSPRPAGLPLFGLRPRRRLASDQQSLHTKEFSFFFSL
jgi:hypothetical protein